MLLIADALLCLECAIIYGTKTISIFGDLKMILKKMCTVKKNYSNFL